MKYRSEVDGLRALAVVPVILFHAGIPYFSGGYVGVDIFFVISGFLITLSILADEHFSPAERVARFYERRIKRIVPALAFVVITSLVVGLLLLLPSELMQLGESAVATALFASNFWFWSQSGYFAAPAETMPLLHTWSLAVEEQFYIVFPLLMIAIGKGRRVASLIVVCLLVAVIFLASVYLTKHKAGVAFYWPTRSWELLLGAWLALAGPGPRQAREAVSLAGLLAIAVSFFTIDRMTPFPGYAALAPVLGAAAVIYGGGETRVGKALSLRPFVWIGLISYSLYLWHWPILVFTKQVELTERLDFAQTTGYIAATFVVAALSWRFVETPFRKISMPRMRLFFSAGALLGGGVAAGFALFVLQGLPNRFSKESLSLAQAYIAGKPENCINYGPFTCQVGAGKPRFLVWGDSHAGALSPAISNIADTPGLYAIIPACPPLPGYVYSGLRGDELPRCRAHNQGIIEKLRADKDVSVVILIAFWSNYDFTGEDLRQLLDALETKTVVIIGDNPTPKFGVARTLALNLPLKQIRPSAPPESFRIIREYPNVKLVELSDALCRDNNCPPSQFASALYADGNHLSAYAVNTIITPFLKAKLSEIMPAPSEAAIVPTLSWNRSAGFASPKGQQTRTPSWTP